MPTTFEISKLTNVTDGGSPDLGEEPTSGDLKDLIDEVVNLSDELVNNSSTITSLNADREFFLGNEIVEDVKIMIRMLKDDILQLKQLHYGDYHMTEMPASMTPPYYGGYESEYPTG